MSQPIKTQAHRIASHGIAETGAQPRRFASLMTGGALVLALLLGAAMPVSADSREDLAKALVAALVVGVIANELNDRDRERDRDRAAPPPVEPVNRARVPSVCAISIDGADRSVTLFSENCLRREGFDRRLPRGCANSAQVFGRSDRVYSAQCLRDAGFRVSGH
jgi:hypothetical protein